MTLIRTSLLSRRAGVDLFVRAEERRPKTFRTKGSLEASYFLEEKLKVCLSDSEFTFGLTRSSLPAPEPGRFWLLSSVRPLSQDVFGFSLQSGPAHIPTVQIVSILSSEAVGK